MSLTSILVLVLFLAALGVAVDNAFNKSTHQMLREKMLGQIYQLLSASNIDDKGQLIMPIATKLPYPQLALPNSGLYAFIGLNNNSSVLWRSPSMSGRVLPEPFDLQVGEKKWQELRLSDGKVYYLLGFRFQRSSVSGIYSYNYYLISELAPLFNQLTFFRQRLWGGLAATLFILLVIQIGVLRWGLKPLTRVSQALSDIELGQSEQIIGSYPREINKLTAKINALLFQERARQSRYRNALADLSHSLKTPLAVLLSGIEHTETLPYTVQEQCNRMMRIVERQLQRAGSAHNIQTLPPLPLHAVTERIIASLSKVYRHKAVQITNRIELDLNFKFDEADFIEIIGNLLDNAYKWCDHRIDIEGFLEGQKLIIALHDDGPGISPQTIQHILQRGGRADESMPGHGIGLCVVAEIIEGYEGQIKIEASSLGGAAVIVVFNS